MAFTLFAEFILICDSLSVRMLTGFDGNTITTWMQLMRLYDAEKTKRLEMERETGASKDALDESPIQVGRKNVADLFESQVEQLNEELEIEVGQEYMARHFEDPEEVPAEFAQQ